MAEDDWPFDRPPDAGAVTLPSIVFEGAPLLFVLHDAEYGGWLFVDRWPVDLFDAAVVRMDEIAKLDPSLLQVADLPPGWSASRASADSPWERSKYLSAIDYARPVRPFRVFDMRATISAGVVGGLCLLASVVGFFDFAPFVSIVVGAIVAWFAAARSPRNEYTAGLLANSVGFVSASLVAEILLLLFVRSSSDRSQLFGFV